MAGIPIAMIVYSYLPKRGLERIMYEYDPGQLLANNLRARWRREAAEAQLRAGVTTNPDRDWRTDLPDDEVERLFLADLVTRPGDLETRMVYADWCEAHGLAMKAAYVRGDATASWIEVSLDEHVTWRAIASQELVPHHAAHGAIRWSELEPLADEIFVRRCPRCAKLVRWCMTDADEQNARTAGELVMRDRGVKQ